MAKQVTVSLMDDYEAFNGNAVPADQTVEFSLDGVGYEIDLSGKNAVKLRNDIEHWAQRARRVGGRKSRGKALTASPSVQSSNGDGMDTEQRKAAREWLRNNTEEYKNLGSRGRIPAEGLALFNRRNGVE